MGIAKVTYLNGKTYARAYHSIREAQKTEIEYRGAIVFVWIPRVVVEQTLSKPA